MKLDKLINHFKQNDYSGKSIIIRRNERIQDIKKTVDSFIFILESKGNDSAYKSYGDTLTEIYKSLKKNERYGE